MGDTTHGDILENARREWCGRLLAVLRESRNDLHLSLGTELTQRAGVQPRDRQSSDVGSNPDNRPIALKPAPEPSVAARRRSIQRITAEHC